LPHDAQKNRIAARWELIGLLEAAHMEKQVTPQLLELSEQAPADVPLLMTVGRKLLTHGSSSSAAEIFREVLRLEPRNGAAQEGLAEADLALSQYADAQTAFRKAIRDGVSNDQVRRLYELANEVLALDPIRHDLSPLERYHRSLLLVQRVAALATVCTSSPEPDAKASSLLERAKQVQTTHVPARNLQAATDSNIMLSEQLYALGRNCRESDPVLDRVLARINAK
jgi:tetratricopeptide (TPR) repeat protein